MVRISVGTVAAAVVAVGVYVIFPAEEAQVPPMEDGWWGYGPAKQDEDVSIHPFKVEVSDDVIIDLKTRLANTRLEDALENTQFQYGFHPAYLKEVIKHWQTEYDWKRYEARLNKFEQFNTTIEGIAIHFLHVNPSSETGQKGKNCTDSPVYGS